MLSQMSHLSDQEYFQYACTDQEAATRFSIRDDEFLELEADLDKEKEEAECKTSLLESILKACKEDFGTKRQLVKDIKRLFKESTVEMEEIK
jgi:hypothetical protein